MAKYVMGAYGSIPEAKSMIEQLQKEGYPTESISVMADHSIVSGLSGLGVGVEDNIYDGADYDTLWKRIKHFFGREVESPTAAFGHQQDLLDGKILVLVDCGLVDESMLVAAQQQDATYWNAAHETAVTNPSEQTIRLMEEHLRVNKENVVTGEVIIKKRVVENTETVDVPIRHEELIIERRPLSGQALDTDKFGEEVFSFPLTEEQVHVSKEPVLVEEVHVARRDVTGEKRISDTVRKEELDVDKTGNVALAGSDKT